MSRALNTRSILRRVAQLLRIYLPLLLLGALAGFVYTLSLRTPPSRRRRVLQITWILMILVGAPVWLFVAATLGWM